MALKQLKFMLNFFKASHSDLMKEIKTACNGKLDHLNDSKLFRKLVWKPVIYASGHFYYVGLVLPLRGMQLMVDYKDLKNYVNEYVNNQKIK